MIGYIKGKILVRKPTELLVETGGIGYIVKISLTTFEKFADKEEAELFTFMAVREDAIELYGFSEQNEKEMFELLKSVNGIGPRLALNILSGIRTVELRQALITGNISRIVSVPGIGRKTAERMLVELKDKIKSSETESSASFGAGDSNRNDAVAALTSLGYNQKLSEKIVSGIITGRSEISLEELIKSALAQLNK